MRLPASDTPISLLSHSNLEHPVNASPQIEPTLTCLELFAGPGGLALGTHAAAFKPLGLVELETSAANTLRANAALLGLMPKYIYQADARTFDFRRWAGKIDLLTGGPPCQPFSGAGSGKGPKDARNMFPTYFATLATVRPRAFLIENVAGLTRGRFQDYFSYILQCLKQPLCPPLLDEDWKAHALRLKSAGKCADTERYIVTHQTVDAADFGIPQRRHRVFIFGYRADLGVVPEPIAPTHGREKLLWEQYGSGTYWDHHGLPKPTCAPERDRRTMEGLHKQLLPGGARAAWRTVRDALYGLPEPVQRGELEVFANHVQHPGARTYPGHSGSGLDMPAKTLKAGAHGTPGGENIVQDSDGGVRYFTTREAARLQTFPDEWLFTGSWGACIRQLGNAVPVDLATLFARQIHRCLSTHPRSDQYAQLPERAAVLTS